MPAIVLSHRNKLVTNLDVDLDFPKFSLVDEKIIAKRIIII